MITASSLYISFTLPARRPPILHLLLHTLQKNLYTWDCITHRLYCNCSDIPLFNIPSRQHDFVSRAAFKAAWFNLFFMFNSNLCVETSGEPLIHMQSCWYGSTYPHPPTLLKSRCGCVIFLSIGISWYSRHVPFSHIWTASRIISVSWSPVSIRLIRDVVVGWWWWWWGGGLVVRVSVRVCVCVCLRTIVRACIVISLLPVILKQSYEKIYNLQGLSI